MKHYLAIVYTTLCLLFALGVQAQDVKVKSFVSLERDLIARTHERLDLNDDPAAVVRVSVPHAQDFSFEGNIIGDVIYSPGEAIVYLAHRSASITIKSDQYGTIKYDFPQRVTKQKTYRLTLEVGINEEKKIRTLVMPVASIGSEGIMSYGFMLGFLKKIGPYVKFTTNLKSFSSDRECDDNGILFDEYGFVDDELRENYGFDRSYPWYTGKTKKTRISITGGMIIRLKKKLYCNVGLGYGESQYGWETTDGEWIKNRKHSFKGAELEIGTIYRTKNIAFSLGYNCLFNKINKDHSPIFSELSLGIGVMF